MATATVVFTGMVYLATVNQPPTLIKAVVSHSDSEHVSTRGGVIPRHVAFIKVNKDFVDMDTTKTTRKASLLLKKDPPIMNPPGDTLVYILNSEKIAISNFTDAPPVVFRAPASALEARFDDAVPRAGAFCPTCRILTTPQLDTTPDITKIGARVDITAGSVIARALSPCNSWTFDAEPNYPPDVQTKLAREVAVDLTTTTDPLVFSFTPLPGSSTTPSKITFKPGAIEIIIGSASIEDIVGLTLLPHAPVDLTDHHFELFYYLMEGSNMARHPLPVADRSCPPPHSVGGVDCPPVRP